MEVHTLKGTGDRGQQDVRSEWSQAWLGDALLRFYVRSFILLSFLLWKCQMCLMERALNSVKSWGSVSADWR